MNSQDKQKLKVGYLINPDPVFYNELDYKIIEELRKIDVEVFEIHLS